MVVDRCSVVVIDCSARRWWLVLRYQTSEDKTVRRPKSVSRPVANLSDVLTPMCIGGSPASARIPFS